MRSLLPLVVFILLVVAAGAFGAQFIPGPWYAALEKPPLNPPSWIFGPVWTLLYLAIAVAGWLVWKAPGDRRLPLTLWGAQLLLNAAWSALFFGYHWMGIALVEIGMLLACVAATMVSFHRVRPLAGWLLVPYLLWVSFASYLNAGLWYLNR